MMANHQNMGCQIFMVYERLFLGLAIAGASYSFATDVDPNGLKLMVVVKETKEQTVQERRPNHVYDQLHLNLPMIRAFGIV